MVSKAAKELAKARAERRSEIDEKFRKRHPKRAREQRALRKAQSRLKKDWGHKRGGTPETLEKASKSQEGALARLYKSGSIDIDQLAYADEIRRVAERIGADAAIGTASYETRVDRSRHYDGTFFEKLGAVRAEVAYGYWRASLPAAGLVLAIIVEDLACASAAKRFRKDTRTVRKLLSEALDAWPRYKADARREVDEATLLAAKAAIL